MKCGYVIFSVDSIKSPTHVEMDCPKCGMLNIGEFLPPKKGK